MNDDEMHYALSKQVPSVTALVTDYGEMPLDDEMREAVAEAVAEILKLRLTSIDASRTT